MDRFYCPELSRGGTVTLPESEARHVRQVLRKQPGETIVLFDGDGRSAAATILTADRNGVTVDAAEPTAAEPATHSLTVAAAVPKADRLKWMVEKLTELGVRRFVPVSTSRSVVEPRTAKLEKLQQTVIAACKQCGRDHLMTIDPVTPFADVLALSAESKLIADTVGSRESPSVAGEGTTLALIGPEGGWTDEERVAAADAGFASVSYSRTVLRTETAAVAAAAAYATQTAFSLQN